MVRNLSHNDWIRQQFTYLRCQYRDVLLHASIIEGTLRKETGKSTFQSATTALRDSGTIDPAEVRIFDEIRETRNKLVHTILKEELAQTQIHDLLNDLLERILEAYRLSSYLDNTLFKKYDIERELRIAFAPVPK